MRNPSRAVTEPFSPRIQNGDGLWSVATRESLRHPINVMMNNAVQRSIGTIGQNGFSTLASRVTQFGIISGGTTIQSGR